MLYWLSMSLLHFIAAAMVFLAALICFYHVSLALVALVVPRRNAHSDGSASHSFAIVIPAHDEEDVIEHTLRSCQMLDYPKDKYRIYVVADNCQDHTVEIVGQSGATCLVRHDQEKRGKGYALEWALPQVLADGLDAIVILDADCRLDSNALRVFSGHLAEGHRVLQANDVVANPDESLISYTLAVANVLENDFFYSPKSVLGMAVFLRGTGMVFHREILETHPWHVSSIVEDAEYAHHLLETGLRIWFVPDIRAVSDFPVQQAQLSTQRRRWVGGGVQLARLHSLRLLYRGLMKRDLRLIDAAWTTLVLSRPAIILQLLLTCLLAAIPTRVTPISWAYVWVFICAAIVAAYSLYVAAGVVQLGLTARRLRLLLMTPVATIGYLLLAIRSVFGRSPSTWQKTPRLHRTGSNAS